VAREAGRTSRALGSALALVGSLAIVVAMVSPAAASPDHTPNGNAVGWEKNHGQSSDTGSASTSGAGTQSADQGAANGANQDCGAYCPSGVGLPSGNGNGDGNATGKPCAGCVGNADDKNPPGQFKDGSDPNNGYECDGNNGVGKTNPAHSGCQTTTTEPQTTTTTTPGETTTTTSPQTTTTVTTPGETTTTVAGETTTTAPTNVLGENFTRTPPAAGGLAFTGGAFARLFWSGVALLLLGLVVLGHRHHGLHREAA
jgi:hypothetical protein